jgi:hypothetical protein
LLPKWFADREKEIGPVGAIADRPDPDLEP